jgi:hypothetical protein
MVLTPTMVYFKKIPNITDRLLNVISENMRNHKYKNEEGYGFIIESRDPAHIQSYFILDYPTYVTKFDADEMTIEKVKVMRKSIVEFLIDLEYGIIETYSHKKNASRIINEIGKLSGYSMSIDDVYFRAKDLIGKFDEKNVKYSVRSLRIQNFSISKYTIGSFFVRVLEDHEGLRLIKEHNPSITYVGMNLTLDNDEISIGFYESGAIRIYNRLDNSTEIISLLREYLFGGRT